MTSLSVVLVHVKHTSINMPLVLRYRIAKNRQQYNILRYGSKRYWTQIARAGLARAFYIVYHLEGNGLHARNAMLMIQK